MLQLLCLAISKLNEVLPIVYVLFVSAISEQVQGVEVDRVSISQLGQNLYV